MRRALELIIIVLMTVACTKHGQQAKPLLLPSSGGRCYEVLVTGPNHTAIETTAKALRSLKTEGLPREEEAFDVSTLTAYELNQNTRYARNIIVVSTDSTKLTKTRFTYELDKYAYPQMFIKIDAPSTEQLRKDIEEHISELGDEIIRSEMNNSIKNLRDKHNKKAEQDIHNMFGCRLWIPEDLNREKASKDFLWLSNDGTNGMQNICIYRYATDTLSPTILLQKRDSVMRMNIEGETAKMYMTTTMRSVSFHLKAEDDTEVLGARGLWQMEGDDMGGPFVSMARHITDSVLCIEGFVYAPGMNKRNMMRRLEAALYTLKIE